MSALAEALRAVLECITETRGKNADAAVHNARAVLAEHDAQPAQEPKWWYASLDAEQRQHQLNTAVHEVGFRKKRSAEGFIAEQLDFQGWKYTLVPLYASSAPSSPKPKERNERP